MRINQKTGISLKLKTRTILFLTAGSGIAILIFSIFFGYLNIGNNKEVNATGNTTFDSNSYIINMGITPQTKANGLLPYGLIYELVNNYSIPVNWVISTTKIKDGIDFSHNGINYKGGAFVISDDYITPEINTLIQTWETQGVNGDFTISSITVPVHMEITSYPRIVVDILSGNDTIIGNYFENAGIPSSAYELGTPATVTACHDVWINPHGDPTWATHSYLYNFVTVNKSFIWSQCHAVSMMEYCKGGVPVKQLNYLTTTGLKCYMSGKCGLNPEVHAKPVPTPANYFHPGDPIMQFMGGVVASASSGSEKWFIPLTVGEWLPTTKRLVTVGTGVVNKEGVLMVYGPAYGDSTNGYVMYQGGHDLNSGSPVADLVAAQRAFFNFLLLAGKSKQFQLSSTITGNVNANATTTFTTNVTGGTPPFTYQWSSSAGGTFSSPNAATTDFSAPHTETPLVTVIRCVVTDACGRKNFSIQSVFINASPLPVKLLEYNAAFDNNNDVLVSWSTASENNIKYYTIERSVDEKNWTIVQNIPVDGHSSVTRNYAWLDENPLKGNSYYKLKHKELNGAIEILGIKKVNFPTELKTKTQITAGPNPFKDAIYITLQKPYKGTTTFRLFNSSGGIVYETTSSGDDTRIRIEIPSQVKKGTYILQSFNDSEMFESIKLIKQ